MTREQSARATLAAQIKEKDGLLEQIAKLKKTNEQLVKTKGGQPLAKRPKYEVKAVSLQNNVEKTLIMDSFRDNVFSIWKFVGSQAEELRAMRTCLENIPSIWSWIQELHPEDQAAQIAEYASRYATASRINNNRNAEVQKVRKVYLELCRAGRKISAGMFLNVLSRKESLVRLPEEDAKGVALPENKAKNEETERRYLRLVDWVDLVLAGFFTKGLFGPEVRSKHQVSSFRRNNGRGQHVITPATEAIIFMYLENYQEKWNYEVALEKHWGRPVKPDDRKEEDYKKNCPKVEMTTHKGGNSKYGGWTAKAKARYNRIRGMIRDARNQPHVAKLEEQVCNTIAERHQAAEEEADKVIDLSGEVGEDSGEVSAVEEYNSDTEEKIFEVEANTLFKAPVVKEKEVKAGRRGRRSSTSKADKPVAKKPRPAA